MNNPLPFALTLTKNVVKPLAIASALTLSACGGSSNNDATPPNTDEPTTPSAVGGIFALTNGHDPAIQVGASDDVTPLPNVTNQIVAYQRMEDGSLIEVGIFATGGLGENIRNSGANPLASQDPLIISEDNRFLFAVNAGSESISSFVINDDMSLSAASLNVSIRGSSNAYNPVSLTIRGSILYVANSGIFDGGNTSVPADRNRINSSIIGFTVADDGTLFELEGSEIAENNLAANVGSIEFSEDGRTLYITERRTNNIVSLSLDSDGVPMRDNDGNLIQQTITANTPQPFGTDIVVSTSGTEIFLVSEGNNGAPGLSAASSYTIDNSGSLNVASASSGTVDDPLITQFTFGCWIESVLAPNGTIYAYTANTPDGTLSGYSVAEDGSMSRLFPVPGPAPAELPADGSTAAADVGGVGVLDTEITYPYLYQVVSVGDRDNAENNPRIAAFEISDGGSLIPMTMLDQENVEFRAGMFVGIAGF